MTMYELLKNALPNNHSKQVSYRYITDKLLQREDVNTIMDLGCGKGYSVDYFRSKKQNIKWFGVDIESSPEVDSRTRTDVIFRSFDGINLPFADSSFDMVFSNQVFEHVRYPEELLKDVCRVLRVGGYFVGSVSHLEPYHSHSLWNYTPYGFKVLIEDSGLNLVELRPGIDALTLIARRICRGHKFFMRYSRKDSPLNTLIDIMSFILRKKHDEINLIKLLFCGQFVFLAKKKG